MKVLQPVHLPLIAYILILLSACDNQPVADKAVTDTKGFSDVPGIKLEVGQAAPDFSMENIDGNTVSLGDLAGQPVLMIFYRGYWCPFCIGHLEDIQSIFPELVDRGYQIVAVSPDDAEGMKKMAERMDSPYLFLSDTGLKSTDAYGIRRDEELPHPAVILLDKQGVVQWFYAGEDYKIRPSASQIRSVLARLNP